MATGGQQAAGVTASKTFERFAGVSAILVGLIGLGYSASFLLAVQGGIRAAAVVAPLLLLLGGLLTTAVMVALHQRLRSADEGFATWALLLGLVGAVGSAIHGAFDVARTVGPPTLPTEIPNAVDPRGFLTFALSGVAIGVFAALIHRGGGLPKGLGWLGILAGFLLVLVYLGRLIVFDPTNPALLGTAALAGFVVNPAWFIWLGIALLRA